MYNVTLILSLSLLTKDAETKIGNQYLNGGVLLTIHRSSKVRNQIYKQTVNDKVHYTPRRADSY